jgi:hypothetical protein
VLRRATLASFDVAGQQQQTVLARSPHARSPHTRSRTEGASPTLTAANSSHQSGLRQIFSSIEEGKEPEPDHEQQQQQQQQQSHKVDLLSE